MVFIYLGERVNVAFPLKYGFSTSSRGEIAMGNIPQPSCVWMPFGSVGNVLLRDLTRYRFRELTLEMFFASPFVKLKDISIQYHFFDEEFPS
jgi:hypothetical protein